MAALEAGLYTESARHFSKIIDQARARGTPQGFVADCHLHMAIAYQATGRVVDAIADCNRSLALAPHCTRALSVRASLFEMVRCFSECLLDLRQLKMIYEASLRRQRMMMNHQRSNPNLNPNPNPNPNPNLNAGYTTLHYSYVDLVGGLEYVNSKIMATRHRLSGAARLLDAHAILELPLNCRREDVERAYLLISLKHRSAEKGEHNSYTDDGGLGGGSGGEIDMAGVKEEAMASASRLTQLIYKAYIKLLSAIAEEEEEEAERMKQGFVRGSYGGASRARLMRREEDEDEDEDEDEAEEEEEDDDDDDDADGEEEDECDFCQPFSGADVAAAGSSPPATWDADWTFDRRQRRGFGPRLAVSHWGP
jgi:hypothetical protein